MTITIPELSLVVLVGAVGSGKSTFARKHFQPTEVLSSDSCRGLVSRRRERPGGDRATPSTCCTSSPRKRLAARAADRHRRHQRAARGPQAAGRAGPPVPLPAGRRSCSTCPSEVCQERNRDRPDRDFGPHVIRNQRVATAPVAARACSGRASATSSSSSAARRSRRPTIERAAAVERPHGRARPVRHHRRRPRLLRRAGGSCSRSSATRSSAPDEPDWRTVLRHPEGRKAVFVGDLVDRGPARPRRAAARAWQHGRGRLGACACPATTT